MSFSYKYTLPPVGQLDSNIVREMFEDVGNYVNNIAAGSIIGTVTAGSANRVAYYPAAGNTVDDLPAITASKALASDSNGLPVASATTATELGYVSGVTSAIQTQIDSLTTNLANETFVVLTASGNLSNERVLTAGTAISITDAGAGSTVTVANTGVTDIHGTADQISVSGTTGSVTLSLPQDIATSSDVDFNSVNVISNPSLVSPVLGIKFGTNSPETGLYGVDSVFLDLRRRVRVQCGGTVVGEFIGDGSDSETILNGSLQMIGNDYIQASEYQFKNSSDDIVTIIPSNSTFSDYTLTLPTDAGTADYALTTDGSGVLSWQSISALAGAATPQLDNLSSVAINTTLVSDTNNTDDLGSSVIRWKDAYLSSTVNISSTSNQVVLGTTRTVTITAPTPASASRTVTLPDLSGDYSVIGTIGNQTKSGTLTLTASSSTSLFVNASFSGDALGVQIQNDSNTASSDARLVLRVGGTSAGDPHVRYRIGTGTTEWTHGIENANGDSFVISQGAALSTKPVWASSTSGAITQPLQPCFLVTGAAASNVTGDGTDYTVTWSTEVYDQGGNFSSNTFTAPVSGRYLLCASVSLEPILSTHTVRRLQIVTSNRTYAQTVNYTLAQTTFGQNLSVIADMDAGDTATVHVSVDGSTKTINIENNADKNTFSGSLIN